MDLSCIPPTVKNKTLLNLLCQLMVQSLETQTLLLVYKRKLEEEKQKKKLRSCWVRPWIIIGQWKYLIQELVDDKSSYQNFLRLDESLFIEVLGRIEHWIKKQYTWWRELLEPACRLAITLQYLAIGDSYKSLSYAFRVDQNIISLIVHENQ